MDQAGEGEAQVTAALQEKGPAGAAEDLGELEEGPAAVSESHAILRRKPHATSEEAQEVQPYSRVSVLEAEGAHVLVHLASDWMASRVEVEVPCRVCEALAVPSVQGHVVQQRMDAVGYRALNA